MSSPKLIIHDDNKKKSVPINITSKSVPVESKLDNELDLGKSPPKVQTSLYKTEKCRSWITTGMCKYGNKCQFAHGRDELRPVMRHPKYKTQTCKTFSRDGFCPYGSRCRFIHPGEIQKNVVPQEYYIEDNSENEIAMSPMSPSLSTSMFSLQIESPSNGNSLFNGSSKSNLMNGNGSNTSPTLLSSSLPTFTDNWMMNNNNPQFNWNQQQQQKQMTSPFNTSKEFNDSQQDSFYDPFNLHENGNSNGSSKPKRDSSLFSKNHIFSPSSPSSLGNSQFQFSPSPSHHQGIFNLSNPTLTSPSQKSMFSFDDEQDLNQTPLKVRTKSTSDLYKHNNGITSSPKEQFPIGFVKSQPTKIPTSGSPITNPNNSSPSSDSKSRLPIFTSLAN